MTVDEFHECDEALRRDPRVIEALAAPRDHRPGPGPDRHLGLRRAPRARGPPRRPGRLGRRLVPQPGGLEPVRQPGHRPALRRRPQPHGAARGRGHPPRRRAGHDGRVRPPPRARPAAARRPQAARDRPARGRLVHARRQPVQLAEVVAARRLQPPRGDGPAHVGYDGRGRSRTGSRSPRWSSPTATRRPTTTAAPRSTSASGGSGS